MPAKGSDFERWFCKTLSQWWTNGKRDDVFWRTAGSGARATTRHKIGLRTFGQYGDVQATDPMGQPLMDRVLIELKRGYGNASIYDVLDQGKRNKPIFLDWMRKVEAEKDQAQTQYWWLITRRDQHQAVIYFDSDFNRNAYTMFGFPTGYKLILSFPARSIYSTTRLYAMRLEDFLTWVSPELFSSSV